MKEDVLKGICIGIVITAFIWSVGAVAYRRGEIDYKERLLEVRQSAPASSPQK